MHPIIKELKEHSNTEKAFQLSKFFQTQPGGYGEGDKFFGVSVPTQRKIAKIHAQTLNLSDLEFLINHPFHEVRLTTLFILVYKMQKASIEEQKSIYDFYLTHLKAVNNWDLVDSSADKIIGFYLFNKDTKQIYDLTYSKNLWKERISIISTFFFIKKKSFYVTFDLALIHIHHNHDLIQKAIGWMLREIGKLDYKSEYNFLKTYYKKMPRTMLRYAIEKFPEQTRQKFLKGEI